MVGVVFHDSNKLPVFYRFNVFAYLERLIPMFTGFPAARTKIRDTCTACKNMENLNCCLKLVYSALAQSPSLLPDGFKVHQAQPIRCDFSKLDYKLCYSEILVNRSKTATKVELQTL